MAQEKEETPVDLKQDTVLEFLQHTQVKEWRHHARMAFGFLLFASLNLIWSIYVGIWWIIVMNVLCVAMLTRSTYIALKWYIAYRERGERLKELIEELFK